MSNTLRLLLILSVFFFTFLSCDDYIEKGMEGRWQLLEIKSEDGVVSKVDTVYYSFKKGVFEYLILTTPTQSFHCFGLYEKDGDLLKIIIDEDSFEPKENQSYFDWDSPERIYTVKRHTSSELVLDLGGEEYSLRKY